MHTIIRFQVHTGHYSIIHCHVRVWCGQCSCFQSQICIILFSISEFRLDRCNTMPKTNLVLYREYHELYGRAHPNLSKGKAHDEVNLKWNSMKKEGKFDLQAYNTEVSALKSKLAKRKLTMFDFANNKVARTSSLPPTPSAAAAASSSPADSSISSASCSTSGGAALTPSDTVNASDPLWKHAGPVRL